VCVFLELSGGLSVTCFVCVCVVCVCFPWFLRGMFAHAVNVFGVLLVVGDAAKYNEHGTVFEL